MGGIKYHGSGNGGGGAVKRLVVFGANFAKMETRNEE